MRRLALLLAALLACSLIAAGCGDDDGDDGDDSAATTESAPADTTSDTDTTSETTPEETDTTSGDVDARDQGIEACKENVQSMATQLSDDVRSDLEGLCEKLAAGDEDEVRDASQEICRKIVEETVPDGSPRDQALAACDDIQP